MEMGADKCIKFVEHIAEHKAVKDATLHAGIPMCKVCNKTIDEIWEEGKEKKSLSDSLRDKSWTVTKDDRAHLVVDLEDVDELNRQALEIFIGWVTNMPDGEQRTGSVERVAKEIFGEEMLK